MAKILSETEAYGHVAQRFTGIIAGLDVQSEYNVALAALQRSQAMLNKATERLNKEI